MIVNLPSAGHKGFRAIPWRMRFWQKVVKTKTCWLWSASKNDTGYGWFKRDGRMRGAHRMAYELRRGKIPSGMSVLHRCDTPACVRPAHLFLGTQADNVRDMLAKGRGNPGGHKG